MEMQARLEEAAERHRVPGAAIGVTVHGVESYAFCGVTGVEKGRSKGARGGSSAWRAS